VIFNVYRQKQQITVIARFRSTDLYYKLHRKLAEVGSLVYLLTPFALERVAGLTGSSSSDRGDVGDAGGRLVATAARR